MTKHPASEPERTRQPSAAAAASGRRTRRRWPRVLLVLLLLTGLVVGVGGFFEVTIWTAPVHAAFNALPTPEERDAWRPESPTLVVLQHGLSSSSWTLWRLQRALEQHGYTVVNPGYPSLDGRIEDFAERLQGEIERAYRERRDRGESEYEGLCFVGHSMGGLVIRSYLSREDARRADRIVFLGTPQNGSAMAEAWIDRWWFRACLSGRGATRQLVPGDPLYSNLGTVGDAEVGVLLGSVDPGSEGVSVIPGPDDGRVGVAEGELPEADLVEVLPLGHFSLSFDRSMIERVLTFLRIGRFQSAG